MENLCMGCGLCCDGTMYRTVSVDEDDEIVPLLEAGVTFANETETRSFLQPCSAFGSGCCTIYDSRPSACRGYRCALLRHFEAGDVHYEEAQALVISTIALRDRVRAQLERYVESQAAEDLGGLYRKMIAKLDAAADPLAAKRDQTRLLLDVGFLRIRLSRHFEARDTVSHQTDEPGDDNRRASDTAQGFNPAGNQT